MKVALLTPQWSGTVGGPSNYVAALAKELRALSHTVVVITSERGPGAIAVDGRAPLRDWRLFQALRQFRPDIIHIHGRFHFMPAALLFRRLSRTTRIVFTFHTQPHVGSFLPGIKPLRPGYNKASRIIAARLLRHCDLITAVSRSIIENLNALYSFNIERFETVPSAGYPSNITPTEIEKFRAAHGLERHAPILASIGVFSWDWKVAGHLLCIDAVSVLVRETPRLVLLIAGDGKYRAYLEAAVRSRGVEQQVLFLGNVPDSGKVLAVADIYLQMALNEGCSLALIEAMLAEKPIIAARRGGTPEVLDDGLSGRLIDPDAEVLAETIRDLLHDDKERMSLARSARAAALHSFTWPTVAKRYEVLYEKALSTPSA